MKHITVSANKGFILMILLLIVFLVSISVSNALEKLIIVFLVKEIIEREYSLNVSVWMDFMIMELTLIVKLYKYDYCFRFE